MHPSMEFVGFKNLAVINWYILYNYSLKRVWDLFGSNIKIHSKWLLACDTPPFEKAKPLPIHSQSWFINWMHWGWAMLFSFLQGFDPYNYYVSTYTHAHTHTRCMLCSVRSAILWLATHTCMHTHALVYALKSSNCSFTTVTSYNIFLC